MGHRAPPRHGAVRILLLAFLALGTSVIEGRSGLGLGQRPGPVRINPIAIGARSAIAGISRRAGYRSKLHRGQTQCRYDTLVTSGVDLDRPERMSVAAVRQGRARCGDGCGAVQLCSTKRSGYVRDDPKLLVTGGAAAAKADHPTGSVAADARGGGQSNIVAPVRMLHFWENMVCGAISRSVAQTIMHPANTMKTILQSSRQGSGEIMTLSTLARPKNIKLLTRGAGAQFLLSVPHGAVNFAVLEYVRRQMNGLVSRSPYGEKLTKNFGPGLDFLSSAISTICCSVVSTPQMMITDNIMAGTYPNLPSAVSGLASEGGIKGFYMGWWPGLAGKIPSYGLTWALFQQLKAAQLRVFKRPPKDIENSMMGCMASATTVCIMIPMDTIKTRLVTQVNYPHLVPYKGVSDAFVRIMKEEGVGAFYRGLTPRLVSVVPMIGIQFGVYEFMKKVMLSRGEPEVPKKDRRRKKFNLEEELAKLKKRKARSFEEVAMEVAADDEQPFPAPQFREEYGPAQTEKENSKKK